MHRTQEQFIQLAIAKSAIKFGEFKLKSGRMSPYFFNAGLICDGDGLKLLGQLYAEKLLESEISFNHLFGPAYKGLPLATATSIALSERGHPVSVTFNRKEVKTHGEGGELIGAPLAGETIMIDDVITAGTAFRQSQQLIKRNNGFLKAVIIALDRCERGTGKNRAIDEINSEGIQVFSIATIFDVVDYLKKKDEKDKVETLEKYLTENAIKI